VRVPAGDAGHGHSVLRLSSAEPMAKQVKLLTRNGWFTQSQAEAAGSPDQA